MFGNLRISSKLMIMVCLAVLGIGAVAGVGLSALRENLIEDRKAKLQELVLLARQAVDLDRQAALKAGLSEAEIVARSKTLLRSLRFGKDDYFHAIDKDGLVQVHPNPKVENQNLIDAKDPDGLLFARLQVETMLKGGGIVTYRFPRAGGEEPLPKFVYVSEYKPYGWALAGGIYVDDVEAIVRLQIVRVGLLVGATLFLVIGMSMLLGRSIVKPVTGLTVAMRKLAEGDIATAIPARERGDEVGAMAQSVQVFKDSMIETERLRRQQEELKLEADTEKRSFLSRMADEFHNGVRASLDTLAKSSAEMRTTSQGMSASAEEASRQMGTVATAAGQATANVQSVAAATEQLSSSVTEIGRQVTQSTQIAAQAAEEAKRTNTTVVGLSTAAQKIGEVVKLISDIANQTNLLALNATIEAARAGDAGKGFAVVASEVKSLAGQTARATEEISAQVAAMQGATSEVVQAIESIGGTITAVNEIATTIAAAVEEQDAATREIARNVQQAAHGTGQVSDNIVGVNRAAGQTGIAASQVLVAAEELNLQSTTLRADIDQFLAGIRAA